MARFTQYIGLSPAACEFLNKYPHREIGKWAMTEGIGMETVTGTIYEVDDFQTTEEYLADLEAGNCYPPSSDRPSTYAEVVDVCPWSSGPMIHTALRNFSTGEICFRWKDDEIHDI